MSPETPSTTTGNQDPAPEAGVRKTLVERLLSPIADVHQNEVATALLLALLMFLILGAYYMLKTAREVFILSEGGAEVKSYSAAGQALLLLFLVPAYGAFAAKVNRERLVTWVTLFFVSNVALFAVASSYGLHIGIPYFLWVGIFNVMVIAQFWAFAADVLTQEQGKRIFPLVGVGSSLGAWLGSVRAGELVEEYGPLHLLISAGTLLVLCVVIARLVSRRATRGASRADAAAIDKPLGGTESGFAMIYKDRYLRLIAALTILLNIVNTTGEYLFGRYVVEQAVALHGAGAATAAAREQFIGATYSHLFSTVNLLGFLLQMFVVSRLFKFLGVGKSLLVHPAVAMIGYLMMLKAPSMALMGWVKVADNSLDYSLDNTNKQALWLPTSREAKYKAKQAVDSFFVRMGDVGSAGLVFVGERLAFAIPAFAVVNVVLVGGWLGVVAVLNSVLRQKARESKTAEL